MARAPWSCVFAIGLAVASAACIAQLPEDAPAAGERGSSGGGGKAGKGGASGNGGSTSGGTSGAGGTSGSGGSGGGDPPVAGVLPITRSARLTHAQYDAALLELFGIADPPSATFAPDASNGFEFDNRLDLRVDARLGPQYRTAAETVAARVAGDAAILERIVPCDAADAGCADEFIASFGRRAFRRPLAEDEASRMRALFDSGATLVASGDAFRDGVRLVIESCSSRSEGVSPT